MPADFGSHRPCPLDRRQFLKYGGGTAAAVGFPSHLSQNEKGPNILIILVDQLRADMPGCFGNNFTKTPALDRLAKRGVKFTRAYCPFPQCSPSRAALMTGLYPNKTGIGIQSDYRMLGDRTVERLDKSLPSIGAIFKKAGYQTGYVGKWHLSPEEPPRDIADYGIDFFSPLPEFRSKKRPLKENGQELIAGFCDPNPMWRGDMSKEAIAFIDRNSRQPRPFLLFYSDYRPHPSYFLPEQEFERFAPRSVELWPNLHDHLQDKPLTHRRLRERVLEGAKPSDAAWSKIIQHYAATVSAVDHQIGLVYDALERNRIMEDTIVVFVSDHGDTCGAHGFWSKGVIAYEELIRIPMIMSWPGHFQAGGTCTELVGMIDVLPTLAEATGTEIDLRQIDGRSLAPFLAGRAVTGWRDNLLIMHHGNMYGLCTMRAVVGNRYKYVYYSYDTGEVYDSRADPWEMRNLINDPAHRQIAAQMHEQLKRLMEEASDSKVPLP